MTTDLIIKCNEFTLRVVFCFVFFAEFTDVGIILLIGYILSGKMAASRPPLAWGAWGRQGKEGLGWAVVTAPLLAWESP